MKKVRTHKFKLGHYVVDEMDGPLDGLCDIPDEYDTLRIFIQDGGSQRALHTAIHEALHAEGLPAKYLDGDYDVSQNVARFLWRLGWRRA